MTRHRRRITRRWRIYGNGKEKQGRGGGGEGGGGEGRGGGGEDGGAETEEGVGGVKEG